VLDASGRVVRRETGVPSEGEHAFAWDGKDQTGAQLPDGGVYVLRVTAKDTTGAAMTPTTTVEGVVRGVEQTADGVRLLVGGVGVPLGAVLSVRQPA
jgi:flagellar basal-body rod modification protein FlgD